MPPGLPASPLSRFLVLGAAFVILVAGMQAAAPILVPFLLSLFITVIAAPPLFYLLRNGLPPWLAILLVVPAPLVGVTLGMVALPGTPAERLALARRIDLALEEAEKDIENTFIKKGIQLAVDGNEEDLIRFIMATDYNFSKERHAMGNGE